MIRLFQHYFRRQALLQVLFDLGLLVAAITASSLIQVRYTGLTIPAATTCGLMLAACLVLVNTASGLYRPSRGRSFNQACARASIALLLALPLTFVVFSFLPADFAGKEGLTWTTLACVAGVITHRVRASYLDKPSRTATRILIFGSEASARLAGRSLRARDPRAQIVGYCPGPNETQPVVGESEIVQGKQTLLETARGMRVDEIVVALSDRRGGNMPLRELLDCKVAGIRVSDISTHFEKTLGQIRIDHLHASWLIFGDGFLQSALRTGLKRLFDIVCALLLLMLALPVLVVTALAVSIDSEGPVLYRQERVGRNGRIFRVIKFRSMRIDAEKDGKPQWASVNDARVTKVGAVLRHFRIDEFPQLFNVLTGEMSLVGPRPERPYFVDSLAQQIPYYALRHSVKPGITGWAQVRCDYGCTVEDSLEKLQYDLYYVKNHTLFLDILILFETVGVVLSGRGAR